MFQRKSGLIGLLLLGSAYRACRTGRVLHSWYRFVAIGDLFRPRSMLGRFSCSSLQVQTIFGICLLAGS